MESGMIWNSPDKKPEQGVKVLAISNGVPFIATVEVFSNKDGEVFFWLDEKEKKTVVDRWMEIPGEGKQEQDN